MDREAWQATVHEVTKSQTPMSTHIDCANRDWLHWIWESQKR